MFCRIEFQTVGAAKRTCMLVTKNWWNSSITFQREVKRRYATKYRSLPFTCTV